MQTTFTSQAVAATKTVLEAIIAQPFLQELAAGTLDQQRFVGYMQQDALYLSEYAKVLALLAAKAPNGQALMALTGFAQGALVVERQLHEQFLAKFNAPLATEMGAVCLAYTSFLLAKVATEPYCVGMAAVLPCFKIYTDVGHRLLGFAAVPNQYQAWLDTYAAPDFEAITQQACTLADTAFSEASPEHKRTMLAVYHTGARLEAWFWADAYQPLAF